MDNRYNKNKKNSINKKKYHKKNNQNSISSKLNQAKILANKPANPTKLVWLSVIIMILFILLILRIGYYQFIKGFWLKEMASRQHTTSQIISPNRGTIYDSNGKILAQSASVDTVTINPSKISEKNKEKVAKAFSDIFELDYNLVLEQVNSKSSVETIIKKVEQDKIDELKAWMEYNDIKVGINIDSDVKRYYPYDNLASNLIGFCDTDNNGQEGLERYWNNVLSGTAGKITTVTDAVSGFIPDKNQTYVAAENGSNITLTIDVTIQSIVEKYLKQACIENNCKLGGTAIALNPTNGDILAMATYPDYNLNTPRSAPSSLTTTWDTLSSSDQLNALFKQWRNRCVADTYEPGSTFKIITAAVGLEENLVDTDSYLFTCPGYEMVSGQKINCWKTSSHGSQSLRQALMNSCNPSLMQLGKKIGASTLYKYYRAFGLFSKTGIATSSEANSYFWDEENVGAMELATMSFGQRFRVTPIQLISAVSSIANKGTLMQPRIVKQIENTDTGAITTIEPVEIRSVVSEETSNKLMSMLESVVTDGTGRYGQVQGYSIAGKTGTSEPDASNPDYGYVASFIAISPVENPQIILLVTLYNPSGEEHGGGSIAAPVASQMLTEILPYMEIPSDDLSNGEVSNSSTLTMVTVPDVRNKTVAEAKKALENAGLSAIVSGNDTTLLVTDQVPKPGISLIAGSTVNIYSNGNEARVSVEVPNLKGMSFSKARSTLKSKNLNINVTGTGTVLSQDPMAGTSVEEGSIINVTLKNQISDTH